MTLAGDIWATARGIAVPIFIGRHALDPMFRVIARTWTPELMTAAALGVVIFSSLVMALASLSYAMGRSSQA